MMIIRIVKMHFEESKVEAFRALFYSRQAEIAAFEGCTHLELWRDTAHPHIFFTYSIWVSETHLNRYRFSDFFKDTWSQTKPLFKEKAEAWSLEKQPAQTAAK